MNGVSPEMFHCLNSARNLGANSDISVLERQKDRMKRKQQETVFSSVTQFDNVFSVQAQLSQVQHFQALVNGGNPMLSELMGRSVKPDPDPNYANGWPDFESLGQNSEIEMSCPISRTSSCPSAVAEGAAVAEEKENEKMNLAVGRESFKKRKANKAQNPKMGVDEERNREKKMKASTEEEESKITELNSSNGDTKSKNRETTTSADTSKENSRVTTEVQKPDYIHVRARRGQATDSHSLAERVRREKISERMKYLQDLVPGCNKIIGKAGMLDEIINYVQSLQRQVEFLSMKLAAVNPRIDFDVDDFIAKEVFTTCATGFPSIEISPEIVNPAYLQFNPMGLDMAINPSDTAIRRTISGPLSIPETFLDSSCFSQMQPTSLGWDTALQTLLGPEFAQGR